MATSVSAFYFREWNGKIVLGLIHCSGEREIYDNFLFRDVVGSQTKGTFEILVDGLVGNVKGSTSDSAKNFGLISKRSQP